MSELTFKSPGVSTREIDLSGPTKIQPSGIPAGVVGTSIRGPAFVPITVATFQDFVSKFGNTDGEKFGPLAIGEWLRFAKAGTYVRILGIGDGKSRTTSGNNAGKVTRAGFVVGDAQVQGNGQIGVNPNANEGSGRGAASNTTALGRTYFLGAFHSASNGYREWERAGIQKGVTGSGDQGASAPIIRGILMAASGVQLTLSTQAFLSGGANQPATVAGEANGGTSFGDVLTGSSKQEFTLILNGQKVTDTAVNAITASFDPKAPNYFATLFNQEPSKLEELGHYLYAHYDVYQTQAVITASNVSGHDDGKNSGGNAVQAAFLLTSSMGRNLGAATTADNVGMPNVEGFEDRYRTAFSPTVISQKFGGRNVDLFKFHALDDGQSGHEATKITIGNIRASTNENNKFGLFDVVVRFAGDTDDDPRVLEKYTGLTLDTTSENYIARRIGDTHTFYDFDKKSGGQKLVIDGLYPNISNYIRVEMASDVTDGAVDEEAIPVGFRGLNHLVTSGTMTNGATTGPLLTGSASPKGTEGNEIPWRATGFRPDDLERVVQPPVPMRRTIALGTAPTKKVGANLCWGVQFERKDSVNEPNKNNALRPDIYSWLKYFPSYHTSFQNLSVGDNTGTPDLKGVIRDSDKFNNNLFSLEKIQVITGSTNRPNTKQWAAAEYRRDGVKSDVLTDVDGIGRENTRFLDVSLDFAHLPTRKFLKFTFPLQGGFDGTNLFDKDKRNFLDNAARREMDDATNQGGAKGPTVSAYRKAIEVMEEKTDVDIQLLAIPGLRHTSVTDFAIESVERRFDAMLIMDIEEKDTFNVFVTSSADQIINVSNTATRHASRNFDTSFAAAYFPDVVITDPVTNTNVQCPPSVAVLGAMSFNDSVAHPWFAPAGFNRGALDTVIESQVKLNRNNLDDLYDVDINPITSFPHTPGVVIFGQKTLLAAASALDRVNVRRLLIDVRRKVKAVANTLLFEPNRESTLAKFTNAVTPILTTIQSQQGLDRFKVQIDTSTTTQADVENNTIRGKIFLQPTRSVEFISLDFVVANAGAEGL